MNQESAIRENSRIVPTLIESSILDLEVEGNPGRKSRNRLFQIQGILGILEIHSLDKRNTAECLWCIDVDLKVFAYH